MCTGIVSPSLNVFFSSRMNTSTKVFFEKQLPPPIFA
jgi:hypothetical protein